MKKVIIGIGSIALALTAAMLLSANRPQEAAAGETAKKAAASAARPPAAAAEANESKRRTPAQEVARAASEPAAPEAENAAQQPALDETRFATIVHSAGENDEFYAKVWPVPEQPGQPKSRRPDRKDWPTPAKSRFEGNTLDYRVVELPPLKKGDKPGELREWLIEPTEGYTAHIEEEYRPAESGDLEIVNTKEYAANQVILTIDGETSFEEFKTDMEAKGAVVKPPLMELDKGAKIVAVCVPEISFDSVDILRDTIAEYNPSLVVDTDDITTVDRTPDDPRYSSLWGMSKIQAPAAWGVLTDASSVVVAIVDTGVNYNHSDLAANMWVRRSSDSATSYRHGMKAIGGTVTGNPLDDNGHGTHCAGTIGAVGNNATGVAGVAWRTKIMACKNLNSSGSGSNSDAILCLDWARQNGAHIVSLSQGGSCRNSTYEAAFTALRSAGIIAVCAAGNNGTNNDTTPHYPSSYAPDNIVAVAATTSTDALASFSCYGPTSVDIAAPGVDILSTYYSSTTSYATMSGTSMATPHVSGALALIKAKYPSYTYQQLIQKLYATGDALSSLSGKCTTGRRVNLGRAVGGTVLVAPAPSATRGTYTDRVVISWSTVSGASHYRVYRATSETGAKTALGSWQSGTSYTDTTVSASTTYYYWVCAATSSSGANESSFGTCVTGYAQPQVRDSYDPGDDTPSSGTTLSPTATIQRHSNHSLSASDKYDFFRISMSAGTTYFFETTGSMDTYGELFNSTSTNSSNRVAYNDDGGTNYNFSLSYTPTTTGTYYLRIRAYSVGSAGSYSLSYWRVSVNDSWDPTDNTPSNGTQITPSASIQTHGPHSLSGTDLYDFYRISMVTGKKYVFESTGSYDVYAELFNSTSTNASYRVAYNDDGGTNNNFLLEYTPTTAGTYYLRVRAYRVGSEASYSLRYSCVQLAQYDIRFCNYRGSSTPRWPAEALLTAATNTAALASTTTFNTNQTVFICFQGEEFNDLAVAGPITNCAKVINNRTGETRFTWHVIYADGIRAGFTTCDMLPVSGLEADSYTVRMTLNEDMHGNHKASETTYTNNVRTIPFTVVNPQKTLSSITISGNASIPAKSSADYRCIGYYSDGSTANLSPTWTISSGSQYASVTSAGRVTAAETVSGGTVVLRATFDGKTATKTIAVGGTGSTEPKPFPDIVTYPSAPMVVEGVVYIHNVAAAVGDQFAAFVGGECRGIGRIAASGRVTMSVNIARVGEIITFKVWDASEGTSGTVFDCLQTLVGSSEPQGTASSPIRFDAASTDPFGDATTEPLVPPTIIEASVSIDGACASPGDILAVFSGTTIVGKAPVVYSNFNGNASSTCRVVMFYSGSKSLSFKLWDADKETVLECSTTRTLASGGVLGSVASPYAIAFTQSDLPCNVSLNTGWNLVSFSVLPENPTPAAVFGSVASSVNYVSDASGNLWGPSIGSMGLNAIRIGTGYWVLASANRTWTVEGRGNLDTEIAVSSGWNLIGYTLPRAGNVADVLRTALASGKVQYITDQAGNIYPGGSLSSMRPGVGYWLRANAAYSVRFDRGGMASAEDSVSILDAEEPESHPFGTPVVRSGVPTIFQNVSVSLFGKPAAFGDWLAVFDKSTGELLTAQSVASEDGTLSFSIMGLTANEVLHFKVWNSASGLEAPEIFETATSGDLTISDPGNDVTGLTVAISGTKPVYTVTYNLDGKAVRTGGGELTQTVEFGGDAVDPVISVNEGWTFVDWDYGKRTDIRGPLSITALYEEGTSVPPDGEYSEMAIYRLLSPFSGEYLYSGNEIEMEAMVAAGWIREGVVFWALAKPYGGAIPLYRLRSPSTGLHLYSSTELEKEILERDYGWVCEGVAFYVDADEKGELSNTVAIYRARSNMTGQYILTSSDVERKYLEDDPGWTVEGIAFWATRPNCTITLFDEIDDSTTTISAAYEELLPPIMPPSRPGLFFLGYEYRYTLDGKDIAEPAYDELGRPLWECIGDMTLYAVWQEADPFAEMAPVYRLRNTSNGDYYFTQDLDECERLAATGVWIYEGEAFLAFDVFAAESVPLYRLYSPATGEHLFSANEVEKNALLVAGWDCEDIVCFVMAKAIGSSTPVYRLCSPATGFHLFTMTEEEKTILVSNYGWADEGVAFYVWK